MDALGAALISPEQKDEIYEFYTEILKENLAHARHIEMERLTFMSLFLVSIGIIAEYSQERGVILSFILGLCTLVANMICTALLRRWDGVYKGHMLLAQKIMCALDTGDFTELARERHEPGGEYYVNNLYNFNNKKMRLPSPARAIGRSKLYIKTATYFYIFNGVTYVMILAFIVNTLYQSYSVPEATFLLALLAGVILAAIIFWRLYNRSVDRKKSS